jgi:hypothetical protein
MIASVSVINADGRIRDGSRWKSNNRSPRRSERDVAQRVSKGAPHSARFPVGPKWCEIRQTVFSWTTQKFPFSVKTAHALKIREPHVITVTGKAFYDIGHAPADHSNLRSTPKGYAVWETRDSGNQNGSENIALIKKVYFVLKGRRR